MEEEVRERRIKTTSRKNKSNDYYVKVTVTQIIVCAVILAIAFAAAKMNPKVGAELREAYDKALSVNWDAEQAMASFKKAGRFLLSPADSWKSSPTGGVDIEVGVKGKQPVKNASFSPLVITAPVTAPVNGKVTSRFGYRVHPITGKQGFHTGLDIAAPEGENIHAAYDGRIEEVGQSDGNGKYIIISHGDFLTVYCHCSEILVSDGVFVRAGETVALVGQTGMATGPHLHFEVRRNGVYYNPEWILKYEIQNS